MMRRAAVIALAALVCGVVQASESPMLAAEVAAGRLPPQGFPRDNKF